MSEPVRYTEREVTIYVSSSPLTAVGILSKSRSRIIEAKKIINKSAIVCFMKGI
ncbi:MAG: hypothetical protein UV63_C0001G0028 [Microgenomates group bacterium GW2011_GWC1_43_11]|uniref:Uncharacterized protein n=2 Tax=Candidatus Gottesmaniibacteriota TaxID=1752720 RepID=A0A0G1IR41_9BACT|nr:MAG: hypothetical protein UV63_C0001G0028 [Microgenomates group bacterium GW2011_GWC1_43_11]KKT39117.1 MAG: hypothetical protein UW22_C0001G0028 [Candidatus Gottesmanbacteria bacterium GW2011_GWB1_44_11c]KKT61590.1 MAG: hypothetical protein UW52_C0001G0028 [Candidatus Gottesmanbacteria bacterium GW2011_GWA1_44_24b]